MTKYASSVTRSVTNAAQIKRLFDNYVIFRAKNLNLSIDLYALTGLRKMDETDVHVTKSYLKEQLDVLGIKNLTEKELDKYTEGIEMLL